MQKLRFFILYTIISIIIVFATALNSFAMGSPQSTNPNGPNYVPPTGQQVAQICSGFKGVQYSQCVEAHVQTASSSAPPSSGSFTGFGTTGAIYNAIIKSGPELAARAAPVGGELYMYLAVIEIVIVMAKDFILGDKQFTELIKFFIKIGVVGILLKEYNFFFNDGVVGVFVGIGQKISNVSNPLNIIFISFDNAISEVANHGPSNIWALINPFSAITDTLVQIFVLGILGIEALMIIGSLMLVYIYVMLALVTGYIFVPFLVTERFEFLFQGWFKFLITSSFSITLFFIVADLFNIVSANINTALTAAINGGNIYDMIGQLIAIAVFAYIFHKIPTLAGEIVSGMPNISADGAITAIMGVAAVAYGAARLGTAGAGAGAETLKSIKDKMGEDDEG